MKPDAVLLAGFGGPTRREEVLPFLKRVAHGHDLSAERLALVAAAYERLGGRSPYNDLAAALQRSLGAELARRGAPLPIYAGMRHSNPRLAEALARMKLDGRRRVAGVILAPHRSGASTDRYIEETASALDSLGEAAPQVAWIRPWFDDPGYWEACAQRIEEATGHVRGRWPRQLPIVFTAHSIPCDVAARSSYAGDATASCRGVAALLGADDWELAWQSRSGKPDQAWLEPDIRDVIARRAVGGAQEIVVQAIGFLFDHAEVQFDLDVQAAETARQAGIRMLRAPCAHDHPAFVAMLADRILETGERFT